MVGSCGAAVVRRWPGCRVPVECLPADVHAADLPDAEQCGDDSLLPIGVRFGDGHVCNLDVPDGEHVLIIGPPRSGRSTALQRDRSGVGRRLPGRLVASRCTAPNGARRASIDTARWPRSSTMSLPTGRVLIAIDDAELVDDIGGALAALAASRRPGLMIVATGKPDSLRQSYGHWTGVVRRSRLGIVMAASNDLDGDLVGRCPATADADPGAARVGMAGQRR